MYEGRVHKKILEVRGEDGRRGIWSQEAGEGNGMGDGSGKRRTGRERGGLLTNEGVGGIIVEWELVDSPRPITCRQSQLGDLGSRTTTNEA